jgi:hypothetical protein
LPNARDVEVAKQAALLYIRFADNFVDREQVATNLDFPSDQDQSELIRTVEFGRTVAGRGGHRIAQPCLRACTGQLSSSDAEVNW